MRFVCIFVAALGLAAAYPKNDVVGANAITQFLENQDEGESLDFEALILSMLERFRQTMITGSETLPVLDPFQLDRLSVDDQTIPLPGLRMTLEDLEVRKLSTFEINSLTFDIISVLRGLFGLSIDGEVPVIALDAGKYDLSVTALGFTIYGNGEAK
ncbi:uncharacterized protein LOC114249974 [Bombyx mandarina]|uniref:Uncharacterized protein LOC114249974 n=1 Tax=Bombyx mandarina TaxID=7092 RepID=A0A6J2KH30_BOMMA|nr:uncharacterized protein LOC114249974 [Bombyx mandarina]